MTMSLTVEVPPEPDDRAVVLDRDAWAWQRDGDVWRAVCAGISLPEGHPYFSSLVKPWGHLLVDRHPLTRLVPEAEQADGWQRAGYDDAECETFVQAGGDVPRHFREGDLEPSDLSRVRDGSSEEWRRGALPGSFWQCTTDYALGPLGWEQLVKRGPLVEPTAPSSEPAPSSVEPATDETPRPDVALPAASATSFLRRVGAAPTVADLIAPQSTYPGPTVVSRRAIRDEPQA